MATIPAWGTSLGCTTSHRDYLIKVRIRAPAPLQVRMARLQRRECECHDMFDQVVPYVQAWRWQKQMVDARCAAAAEGKDGRDTVLVLQHLPVYTLGTRSSDEHLRFDKDNPPFEIYRTERGGEVTYHGPGQLVMYPILNLRHHRQDLHWYMRSLEEVVIRALRTACALEAHRIEGLTGVWIDGVKVAAIGVRVARWFTYHGLALNVNTDLKPFQNIVPCGISDRPVGSIREILSSRGQETSLTDGRGSMDPKKTLTSVHTDLLQSFSDVFELDLVPPADLLHLHDEVVTESFRHC